jgi:hypothetical protein
MFKNTLVSAIEDLALTVKNLREENKKLKTENELLKLQIAGKIYDV